MTTEPTYTKQQQKSRATKDKIFLAAKDILQRDGYDALSIKNICELAGVSNGSFYHHFSTKEDLLSYYIEHLPGNNSHMFSTPSSLDEAIHSIIQVYLNYVDYCQELGVAFLSNYYVPRNEALNPHKRTERAYPIITVQQYLERGIEAGTLKTDLEMDDITTDIRMLIIGNVFEWCINNGEVNFKANIERSLRIYLQSAFKA